MKQKLQAILDDDRGVSPVIGVILMVAITVILAAVIGTFVLGLGDSLEQAPQATLDAEVTTGGTSAQQVSIAHNGGDSIPKSELKVMVGSEEFISSDTAFEFTPEDYTVGSTITIDSTFSATGDTQVRVIHQPSESIILNTEVTLDSNSGN